MIMITVSASSDACIDAFTRIGIIFVLNLRVRFTDSFRTFGLSLFFFKNPADGDSRLYRNVTNKYQVTLIIPISQLIALNFIIHSLKQYKML